jgi:2-(1,2-epoxy-1,2-dihydrophenyl)acetyl-CoA isomerase
MAESSEDSTYRGELAARGPIPPCQIVQTRREARVAVITLDDPATLNCYSLRMTGELRHALAAADEDPAVGAVILTENGPAFSAGGDIRLMRDKTFPPAEHHAFIRHEFGGLIDQIVGMDKPVVAAVNGHAMGVGFFTVLACDLVVASERARFGTAYIKLGMTPLGVSYLLAATLGYARAFELCALGDILEPQRALALGLVNRVVPHESLLAEAGALAQRLADGPPRALAFTKQLLRRAARAGLEEHVLLGEAIQPLCLASAEHREAVDAFAGKRHPAFSGG